MKHVWRDVPPESVPSNYDIPKPIKGPVTDDLGLSFVKRGKEHVSRIALELLRSSGPHGFGLEFPTKKDT